MPSLFQTCCWEIQKLIIHSCIWYMYIRLVFRSTVLKSSLLILSETRWSRIAANWVCSFPKYVHFSRPIINYFFLNEEIKIISSHKDNVHSLDTQHILSNLLPGCIIDSIFFTCLPPHTDLLPLWFCSSMHRSCSGSALGHCCHLKHLRCKIWNPFYRLLSTWSRNWLLWYDR